MASRKQTITLNDVTCEGKAINPIRGTVPLPAEDHHILPKTWLLLAPRAAANVQASSLQNKNQLLQMFANTEKQMKSNKLSQIVIGSSGS